MPKPGTKRTRAIGKLKKSGATQDQIRSFLRGWDQLDYLVEKQKCRKEKNKQSKTPRS